MDKEDLEAPFIADQPHYNPEERYEALRAGWLGLGLLIDDLCPDSLEKSYAIADLAQAIMWANAAIARNQKADQPAPEATP